MDFLEQAAVNESKRVARLRYFIDMNNAKLDAIREEREATISDVKSVLVKLSSEGKIPSPDTVSFLSDYYDVNYKEKYLSFLNTTLSWNANNIHKKIVKLYSIDRQCGGDGNGSTT